MIRIITDGACTGNPGPGGWAAILVEDGHVEEIGGREAQTTNNRMEMTAAIEALKRVPPDAPVHIVTDSEYLMKGITSWIKGWKRRGWTTAAGTPVLNQDLWQELDQLAGSRVSWEHVRGHRGHPENERADEIATSYARGKTPPPPGSTPAAGPDEPAPTRARRTSTASPKPAPRPTGSLGPRPYGTTYLSLVGGRLERHTTWEACRARVHGAPGARYKKCRSLEEEVATVQGWGLPAGAVTGGAR